MADLPLGGLGAILDLGVQLRLHPDAPRDPLCVRFCGSWREALAQLGGWILVEALGVLAGIDQLIALAAAEIDAVPVAAVERKAGGERLPLGAGRLDPIAGAP